MSEHPGPPTLSLALRAVLDAAMEGGGRTALLSVVRPGDPEGADGRAEGDVDVVPFPAPRRPQDDDPSAA